MFNNLNINIMRKLFLLIPALAFALMAKAQGTDFAAPGYSCAASQAALSGTAASATQAGNSLYYDATNNELVFTDISISNTAIASWSVSATRACYVSVSLEMGTFIGSSNKHIFDVKILDSQNKEVGH